MIPLVDVNHMTEVVGNLVVGGLVLLFADDVEFHVSVNLEVGVVT